MKIYNQYIYIVIICCISCLARAEPMYYVTHNRTDFETKTLIASDNPIFFSTPEHSSSKIDWWMLQHRCETLLMNHTCKVLLKAETNSNHPVELGVLTIDLKYGEIYPKYLSANGYSVSVIGIGEIHIYKNP